MLVVLMRNTTSDKLYYSTVQVKCGDGSSGTAYFVVDSSIKNALKFYLVSNNHVVKNKSNCSITFHRAESTRSERKVGIYEHKFRELKWQNGWKSHPDPKIDIAVMSLNLVLNDLELRSIFLFFRAIDLSSIPSAAEVNLVKAIEEITYVGYPAGLIDTVNNLPIARKGCLATPLHEDFNGEPIFLIDGSVFGGSSGSPVCLLNESSYSDTNNNHYVGANRFHLIGTIFQNIELRQNNQSIDIGKVLKASTILETINHHF